MKAPRASFYFIVGSALGELASCTENLLDVSGEVAEKVVFPPTPQSMIYSDKNDQIYRHENMIISYCHTCSLQDSFSKSISRQIISRVGDSFGRAPKRISPSKKNQKVHRNNFSTRRI